MFRSFLVGCSLIDEMVVQAGVRAVAVADGIDTHDRLKWHLLMAMGSMGRGFRRRRRC